MSVPKSGVGCASFWAVAHENDGVVLLSLSLMTWFTLSGNGRREFIMRTCRRQKWRLTLTNDGSPIPSRAHRLIVDYRGGGGSEEGGGGGGGSGDGGGGGGGPKRRPLVRARVEVNEFRWENYNHDADFWGVLVQVNFSIHYLRISSKKLQHLFNSICSLVGPTVCLTVFFCLSVCLSVCLSAHFHRTPVSGNSR